MLLNERIEARVLIRAQAVGFGGAEYFEASLISDDGQTLHIHEGQLKEVPGIELQEGKEYVVTFRPFINNRWIEFKIVAVRPA